MRWFKTLGLLVAGLLLAAVVIGSAGARRDPVVVRYTVALHDMPRGTPPLRIVQISDVHYHWLDMGTPRLDRIVREVNALRADAIVLTGDYSGGKAFGAYDGALSQALGSLRHLRGQLGVVAVRGNHDGPRRTPPAFRAAGMLLLVNRWIDLGPVVLAGVDDVTGNADPDAAVRGAPQGKPLVMLGHEPNIALRAPPRVDLFIAGHTHGGQIKLPWLGALTTGSPFLDAHLRGAFVVAGRPLIVSSGIGTSIVPLRIGVPPEVVVITLVPAAR